MHYRKFIVFLAAISCVLGGVCCGEQPPSKSSHKNIEATASMWIEGDVAKVRIDYATTYRVQELHRDNILRQYCVDFYEGDRFVGGYYWWNEQGSSLPLSATSELRDIKVREGWRAVFSERYFDVGMETDRKTEEELGHWFRSTWWKFNSVVPEGVKGWRYTLQPTAGMPDMETYLRQSGFDIHAELSFSSTIAQIPTKAQPQNVPDNR